MVLHELASFQSDGLPAYFKGGTALYKALHSVRRFSEDIDLSVDVRDCSRSQGDKRLDRATKNIPVCRAMRRKAAPIVQRSSPTIIMNRSYDTSDVLQRFGKVKVEATSFTISEPYESMRVAPIIYENAEPSQQAILADQFDVSPFEILTMTMERILWISCLPQRPIQEMRKRAPCF